jgi:hypothetical protein
MITLKIKHFQFVPVIGLGYWKEEYKMPSMVGSCYNIILPFVRFQYGELHIDTNSNASINLVEVVVVESGRASDGKPAVTVEGRDLLPGVYQCIETYQGLYGSGWHLATDIAIRKFKSGDTSGVMDIRPAYRLPFDFENIKP